MDEDFQPLENEASNIEEENISRMSKNESAEADKNEERLLKLLPKNMLICPFCSDEYLFEFSMREHLKRHHSEEIKKLDSWPVEQFYCPFCRAMLYYSSLIPKHIYFAHGKEMLDEHFNTNDNLQKYQIDKENANEPSVRILDCSPGLSSLFNDLDTCDSVKKFRRGFDSICCTPVSQPRSILKKTPYSGRIVILSPESAALRRTINSLKRSASARRELRFDLPPLPQATPPKDEENQPLPPLNFQPSPKKKKNFWSFFASRKSPPPINTKIKKKIRAKACQMSNRSANQIVTSTPMGGLDDSYEGCDAIDNTIGSNWRSALKTSNFQPLFLTAERFQCNFCQAKFDSNAELKYHQKNNHRRISFLPPFKCGQCSSTFYRNSYLVRHCHYQHTPSKN